MSDHIVLTVNGIVVYESSIGTRPPVQPTPTPAPTPAPPPADDPCALCTDPIFLKAIAEGREMGYWDLMKRGFRGPTDQEKACMASRGIPKKTTSTPIPDRSGSVLASKGVALRNKLTANAPHRFTVPTIKGERVQIQVAENASTVHGDLKSEVRGPAGELLSGPADHGSVFYSHDVISPGGMLSFYITSSVDTSLSFIRN
jgi:hypothetical protein